MERLPPKEKIYEAWSAIADGRVALAEGSATVRSSDGSKTYTVRWEGDLYSSDDNASHWQGYPGYPILAVLMLQGRLPFDAGTAAPFRRIDWNRLNKRYRSRYDRAAEEVMSRLQNEGVDTGALKREADAVYRAIEKLGITVQRGSKRPTG